MKRERERERESGRKGKKCKRHESNEFSHFRFQVCCDRVKHSMSYEVVFINCSDLFHPLVNCLLTAPNIISLFRDSKVFLIPDS